MSKQAGTIRDPPTNQFGITIKLAALVSILLSMVTIAPPLGIQQ